MLIYKTTNTLDSYLLSLPYTENKSEATVLLVGGKNICLDEFPNLRGIFKTGVGIDNLPFAEAAERGVVLALPSEMTCNIIYEETASFTCYLILTGLYAEAGGWDTWLKVDRPVMHQNRLLVVGNGRIGFRVVERMRAFMEVDTFDLHQDDLASFEQKVRSSDCVTLHVPLTAETRSLFNAERLAWLRDGALLVNTARGAVVDEDALFAELSSGRLRAAFDVFWEEPYRGRLTELPPDRFIKTPHIASTCREFLQGAAIDFMAFMATLSTVPTDGTND